MSTWHMWLTLMVLNCCHHATFVLRDNRVLDILQPAIALTADDPRLVDPSCSQKEPVTTSSDSLVTKVVTAVDIILLMLQLHPSSKVPVMIFLHH